MPPRAHGLSWLDSKNRTQLKWAQNYLEEHGLTSQWPEPQVFLKLKELGLELEKSDSGKRLLVLMKGAWRQFDNRKKDARKAYAFRLLPQQKADLDRLAKQNNQSSTELLVNLLTDSSNLHAKLKGELEKAKNKLQVERLELTKEVHQYKQVSDLALKLLSDSTKGHSLAEVLLRDAALEKRPPTNQQTTEAESIATAKMAEYNATLEEKRKSLDGLHNIKSLMDRPNSSPSYIKRKSSKAKNLAEQSDSLEDLKAKLEAERARREELERTATSAQKRADELARELNQYKKAIERNSGDAYPQPIPAEEPAQDASQTTEDARNAIINYVRGRPC